MKLAYEKQLQSERTLKTQVKYGERRGTRPVLSFSCGSGNIVSNIVSIIVSITVSKIE